MIRLTNIMASGLEIPLDFSVRKGGRAAICTSRDLENDVILRLLLGFQDPEEGTILVNSLDPGSLKESQLVEFRRKTGVIYHDGGLISNLSIWENLTLQFLYFSGLKKTDIEERGRAVLELVGYDGSVSLLPSRLSIYHRRLVAFARSLLNGPDLLICQSVLDGLSREEQQHLGRKLCQWHEDSADRTLIVITSYPESLHGLDLNIIHNTGGPLPS